MATSIKLDPKLKARVDEIARVQRRSAHWIMIEAIRLYVEQEERGQGTEAQQPWASFQDRTQDEIESTIDGNDALKRSAEAKTPYDKFMALAGAGAATSTFKTKEEIDAYVRWLREDD